MGIATMTNATATPAPAGSEDRREFHEIAGALYKLSALADGAFVLAVEAERGSDQHQRAQDALPYVLEALQEKIAALALRADTRASAPD